MARVQQVIHVKDLDGTVRECALFDSDNDWPSTIPSECEGVSLGLDGTPVWAALLHDTAFVIGTDEAWLSENYATNLHVEMPYGPRETRVYKVLTSPYFIRPLVTNEGMSATKEGTSYSVDDLVSHDGESVSVEVGRGYDFITVRHSMTGSDSIVLAENTGADRAFSFNVKATFADGSEQSVTFGGTQEGTAVASEISVSPTSATHDADGATTSVRVTSNTS